MNFGGRQARSRAAEAEGVAVFTVGGERFVTGLHWKTLSARGYMSEARQVGRRFGWNMVAVRKGQRVQAGFVTKGTGVGKGVYSAAAALAGILGDNWLGAFDTGAARYLLVGVRQGSVVPGYDRLVDHDEAVEALREGKGLFPNPEDVPIYAPADMGFRGDHEKALTDLLSPVNLVRDYQLRLLGINWVRVVGVLALCVAVGLAYEEYQQQLLEQERALTAKEQARRVAELAKLNASTKVALDAKSLEHPWARMPGAADFVGACVDTIERLPLSIAGWIVEKATCDGTKVVAGYRRNAPAGPVTAFRAAAAEVAGDQLVIASGGERAEVTVPVVAKLGGDDELLDAVTVPEVWIARLQGLGLTYQISEKPVVLPSPPSAPGAAPVPPPVATWRLFPLTWEGDVNPRAVVGGVARLGGARVLDVVADVRAEGSVRWLVHGELYAKR